MRLLVCQFVLFVGVSCISNKSFPKDFRFGAATAAYQIEGGWNEGGRGVSMWDDFVHTYPEYIRNNDTGDVACDSYHKWREDAALLKDLKAGFYRISISWTRIFNGTSKIVNQEGVDYYVNLLKLLKEYNIEPIVTLYHWDLPLYLHQMGGWTNPDIVPYFGEYARACFKYFGEYVKYWITLNEPESTCFLGYGSDKGFFLSAPAYDLKAEGVYLCAYTHIKAHALAYRIYEKEFKAKQNGKISLSLISHWYEPVSNSTKDLDAQNVALQYNPGLFAHPIYIGNWPQVVIDRVAKRSKLEGLQRSRLPEFTKEEIEDIKGTFDFFGMNYYVTYMVQHQYNVDDVPGNASYLVDAGFASYVDDSWPHSDASTWLTVTPWGFAKILRWVQKSYNPPEIIITENGWSDDGSRLDDPERIDYMQKHLSVILDAIDEGIPVTGYTHWSLMDNFEWANGYRTLAISNRTFPKDFKFGVSTSSYQIEGGWNDDGRGVGMWDDYVHTHPEYIVDRSNGDVACDSYHRYEEDIALLKNLNSQFYRFSIAWTRIFNGTSKAINQKGVDYYIKILKLLKQNNIEPIVTIYHWDLPLYLHEMGGWINPDIVPYYGEYARACFELFGDYVKYWVTLNEPTITCLQGYAGHRFAPGYDLQAEGAYLCAYTHIKAHALAYHIYQEEFKSKQNGKVSISIVGSWFEPASTSAEDLKAQELALQFYVGMFAHPIYVGNWPQVVIDRVAKRSQMEGLKKSRLPEFTLEEIENIKGTYDWFGLNYYVTNMVKLAHTEDKVVGNSSFLDDAGYEAYPNNDWKYNKVSTWLTVTPWAFSKLLTWIDRSYNHPEIIVTENGWADDGSSLDDQERIDYVQKHLSAILDVIYEDGVKVTGYTYWSLMDNFEWESGYTSKFGIVSVDFKNENRTRTPKLSYNWYKDVITTRCLVDKCDSGSKIVSPTTFLIMLSTVILSRLLF